MFHGFRAVTAGAALLVASAGAAMAYPATVTSTLNLRSGPGTGYGVVARMPAGARVNVRACVGGGWCNVGFRGVRGYANRAYLAGGGRGPAAVVGAVLAPEFYAYAYEYPPYWRNGYYYYWYGGHWRHIRRDRGWWNAHRAFIRSHRSAARHERRFEHRQIRHARTVVRHERRAVRHFHRQAVHQRHVARHAHRAAVHAHRAQARRVQAHRAQAHRAAARRGAAHGGGRRGGGGGNRHR